MSEQYPNQTTASAAPQPSQEINRRVRSVFDYVEMFAIAVAVDIREIGLRDDEQRLPQGVYCFGLAVACAAALNRFASDFRRFLM